MNSFAYNKLMSKYLELIEDKDDKVNSLMIFSSTLSHEYNIFLINKSDIKYPIEAIRNDLNNIRKKKKEYKEMEEDINKLNNQIAELGTRLSKLKADSNKDKKVKFLIPHTDEFRFMKAIYSPVSVFDIIM